MIKNTLTSPPAKTTRLKLLFWGLVGVLPYFLINKFDKYYS